MQLNRFIRVINFRLRLYAWIRVAVATKKFLNVIFHFGHFRAVIEFTWLDLSQALNFSRVPCQVTRHLYARQFVLVAFGDVNGDVDAFFIRRQAHLRGIDVETGVTAIQVVAAQGFKVTRQLLFLVFTIADHVPPRHFVTQLEG